MSFLFRRRPQNHPPLPQAGEGWGEGARNVVLLNNRTNANALIPDPSPAYGRREPYYGGRA